MAIVQMPATRQDEKKAEQLSTLTNCGEVYQSLAELANRKTEFDKSIPALMKKYNIPEGTDKFELLEVYRAEKQNAKCEGCGGYELCNQPWGERGMKKLVQVEGGRVYVLGYRCKFAIQVDANRNFKLAKIPKKFIGKTFDDYEITGENFQAVSAAKKILNDSTESFFINGEPGTGKTFLASLIASNLIRQGKQILFSDVPSLLTDLKRTFKDGKTKEADLIDELCKVPILFLDDLGAEQVSGWSIERLYIILNSRINESLPTIITSNFTLQGLENRYTINNDTKTRARQIADRINDFEVVGIKGTSRRGKR